MVYYLLNWKILRKGYSVLVLIAIEDKELSRRLVASYTILLFKIVMSSINLVSTFGQLSFTGLQLLQCCGEDEIE